MSQLQEDIQNRVQEQAQNRILKANKLIQAGIDLYSELKDAGYTDKKQLRKVAQLWMDAIQLNRKNPNPYLYLAQLFLTFNANIEALKYLQEVKKFAPNDPDLLMMMEYVGQASQKQQKPDSPDMPDQDKVRDLDDLYDKVENFLHHKVKAIMTTKKLPKFPSIFPEEIETMEATVQELKEVCHSIQMQLEILDKELCVSELRVKFHPLIRLKNQFIRFIELSQQLKVVYGNIRAQTMSVLRLIQQLQSGNQSDINIEDILDKCDDYADKLDYLSIDHPDHILAVEPAYEKLLKVVDSLQDELENQEEGILF